MLAHFPDGKTEAQRLQSFARSPKASQWLWLSVLLIFRRCISCCLLLPYIAIVPRKGTEIVSLSLRNGRPCIELRALIQGDEMDFQASVNP